MSQRITEDEGWDDLKIAFGAEDEDALWNAPATTWPAGWELNETDRSGARLVVVFRVHHLPSPEETMAVRDAIRKLS